MSLNPDPVIFLTQDLFGVATETSTIVEVGPIALADDLLVTVLDWATSEDSDWIASDSRNGRVIRAPALFTTSYHPDFVPVMLSTTRDANPFLHYVESMYFLCGRKDLRLMEYFAAQMKEYSDDGETLWGSYGYRWSGHFEMDQLDAIVHELRKNPGSRRCVLQMWDGYADLARAIANGKDVPCNHVATFDTAGGVLNMTVTNRSNDMIWGTYGANMVHFNILLTYMAHATGLPKGRYHQVSSNTHVYVDFPITQRFLTPEGKIRPAYLQEVVPTAPWGRWALTPTFPTLFWELDYSGWCGELNLLDVVLDEFMLQATNITPDTFGFHLPNEVNLKSNLARHLILFMKAYALYKNGFLVEAIQAAKELALIDSNPFFFAGVKWLELRLERKLAKEQSA